MNQLDFIIDVECFGFDPENEEHVSHLQKMIDSGLAWQLQGFWGRLARGMINSGVCSDE